MTDTQLSIAQVAGLQEALDEVPESLVPDPSAEADGRMLEVADGALVYTDAPTGGEGGVIEQKGARVTRTATQSIPNNTATAIEFTAESHDTDGFHDNSTNNTRLTIPTGGGGLYLVGGRVLWSNTSTGERSIRIYKNGVDISDPVVSGRPDASYFTSREITDVVSLVAGDYLELFVQHDNGSAVNVQDAAFWLVLAGGPTGPAGEEGEVGGGGTTSIIGLKTWRVRRAAAGQSIPNNAATALQWDTGDLEGPEAYDAANNTRWTCPEDGLYRMNVSIRFTAGNSGLFGGDFVKNGVTNYGQLVPGSSATPVIGQFTQYHQLVAGDYFTLAAYQNSGSAKTIDIPNTYITGELLTPAVAVDISGVELDFVETNVTPTGLIGYNGAATEMVVPGMDLYVPAVGAIVEIDGLFYWSQTHSQTAKRVTVRLRRDNASGEILASDTQDASLDSGAGHDRSWTINYTDSAPTTGRYVVTIQTVAGYSTSAVYSDTRTFQIATSVVGTGGESSGGSSLLDPRWTAKTAHAQNREFRSASDLTGAIRVDNSTNNAQAIARSTWEQDFDSLHVWNRGDLGHVDAAAELHGYVWPYALAVGEAIQGHIVLDGIQQAYASAGLVVSDGVTFGSGTQIYWSHWHATDLEGNLQDAVWTGWNTRSAFTDRSRALTYGNVPLHFRLLRSATSEWKYYVSSTGKNWTLVSTRTQALTPTHIGFATGMWSAAGVHGFAFDYLRVVTP